jgi:O-antigen ligase
MTSFFLRYRVSAPTLPTSVALLATLVLGPLIGLAIALEAWKLCVLLVLIAGVPALIRWPVAVAFGMYAMAIPFDSVGALETAGGSTVSRLLGVLASGLLLGVGLRERRLVHPPATALPLGLFVFWAVLSLGWSVDLEMSMGGIRTLVSVVMLYVVATSFRVSAKELRAVILLAILGAVLAASVTLILGEDSVTKGRTTLTLEEQKANINYFAFGLVAPLLLAIGRFLDKGRFTGRALALGAMAVIVSVLYTTASRGALLAAILGLALLVVRTRRVWQGFLVVAVCLMLLSFAPEIFFNRVTSVVEGTDTTGTGRTRIWKIGLRFLEQYGIFGSGYSTFVTVYSMYVPVPPSMKPSGSHSIYLGTWVELGIVGLILLLLTITMHFRASLRCRRPSIDLVSIEAGCLALIVSGAVGDYLRLKAFWLPWMLSIWSVRLHEEEQRRAEPQSEHAVQRVERAAMSESSQPGAFSD